MILQAKVATRGLAKILKFPELRSRPSCFYQPMVP